MKNIFKRYIFITGFLSLLSIEAIFAAETLYVIDRTRVGVRSEPNIKANTITVVTTGHTLEVIESKKSYIKVKTPDKKTGWISRKHVQEEPPAFMRLEELEEKFSAEQATWQQRIEALGEQWKKSSATTELQLDQVSERNLELEAEVAKLQKSLEAERRRYAAYQQQEMIPRQYFGPAIAVALLLSLLMGILYGYMRSKRKIRHRFGGLEP